MYWPHVNIAVWLNMTDGPVPTVELGGVNIKPSSSVRSLGIIIDDTLSFDEHVDSVCKASNFHLRALRHIRKHISEACTMMGGWTTLKFHAVSYVAGEHKQAAASVPPHALSQNRVVPTTEVLRLQSYTGYQSNA
jgi:hypothetical protein